MVDDFIKRKRDPSQIVYNPPQLESILKETYGVIVYQEQVMAIANQLAGFSLGQADLLRRAMGKKKPEEMAQQKELFVAGAKKITYRRRNLQNCLTKLPTSPDMALTSLTQQRMHW